MKLVIHSLQCLAKYTSGLPESSQFHSHPRTCQPDRLPMVRDDQTDFGDEDPDNVTVCNSDTASEAHTIFDDNATVVPDDGAEVTEDEALTAPCSTGQQRPQPCQEPERVGQQPKGHVQLTGQKENASGTIESKTVTTSQNNPEVEPSSSSMPAASSTESPVVSSVTASSLECDARPRATGEERKKNRREMDADPDLKDFFVSHRHYEREVLGKKKGRGGKKGWKRYWY